VAIVFALAVPAAVRAVELRALGAEATADGAVVSLELSPPTTPAVSTPGTPGEPLRRLYVDLPPGTRVARTVPRHLDGPPPVRALRVGAREGGAPRLVLGWRGPRPTTSTSGRPGARCCSG
jgi:hypothetical protein